jgi:hypothetical protein
MTGDSGGSSSAKSFFIGVLIVSSGSVGEAGSGLDCDDDLEEGDHTLGNLVPLIIDLK